ncbi:MAG: sigT [Chlorobi bacterium]|nr:sigT [Chlorobiota bacterium]
MASVENLVAKNNETKASKPLGNDEQLFARFMAGDDAAFMELFDRHTHRLYMYCLKFVGNEREAEDLVQDLWERVIRLRADGRDAVINPVGFMVRMARNLSLNHIRDRRNTASLDDLPEQHHPSSAGSEMSHNEELVVAALARLPDSQRDVLILNAYSGYRFDEIAEMLGEPVGAVRTRAWRGRMQLGRIISAYIGLDENKEENGGKGSESNRENEE